MYPPPAENLSPPIVGPKGSQNSPRKVLNNSVEHLSQPKYTTTEVFFGIFTFTQIFILSLNVVEIILT